MAERVRWETAWPGDAPGQVLVEFRHSPDYEPCAAIVDDQPEYVGIHLEVRMRAESTWERQSLERHVAAVTLPFDPADRPFRDVRPRRPSDGMSADVTHHLDPDRDPPRTL
jgi:hypothetical protein